MADVGYYQGRDDNGIGNFLVNGLPIRAMIFGNAILGVGEAVQIIKGSSGNVALTKEISIPEVGTNILPPEEDFYAILYSLQSDSTVDFYLKTPNLNSLLAQIPKTVPTTGQTLPVSRQSGTISATVANPNQSITIQYAYTVDEPWLLQVRQRAAIIENTANLASVNMKAGLASFRPLGGPQIGAQTAYQYFELQPGSGVIDINVTLDLFGGVGEATGTYNFEFIPVRPITSGVYYTFETILESGEIDNYIYGSIDRAVALRCNGTLSNFNFDAETYIYTSPGISGFSDYRREIGSRLVAWEIDGALGSDVTGQSLTNDFAFLCVNFSNANPATLIQNIFQGKVDSVPIIGGVGEAVTTEEGLLFFSTSNSNQPNEGNIQFYRLRRVAPLTYQAYLSGDRPDSTFTTIRHTITGAEYQNLVYASSNTIQETTNPLLPVTDTQDWRSAIASYLQTPPTTGFPCTDDFLQDPYTLLLRSINKQLTLDINQLVPVAGIDRALREALEVSTDPIEITYNISDFDETSGCTLPQTESKVIEITGPGVGNIESIIVIPKML